MSMALGLIIQFSKKHVWTAERAATGGLWKWMYITMGVHAPLLGFIAGLIGFPVSPGVHGMLGAALYHFVAGAISAWTVAAFKHFVKSYGINIDE